MGMPVRIDRALYEQAKSHAHAERRTQNAELFLDKLSFGP